MIIGIGCDIVSNKRIQTLQEEYGERFAHKILADRELVHWQAHPQPAAYLAKRFAAKEAFAKAIGTGFRDGLLLKHIAVVNDALGAPSLLLSDEALNLFQQKGGTQSHLSLSDDQEMSMAFVVLEAS